MSSDKTSYTMEMEFTSPAADSDAQTKLLNIENSAGSIFTGTYYKLGSTKMTSTNTVSSINVCLTSTITP